MVRHFSRQNCNRDETKLIVWTTLLSVICASLWHVQAKKKNLAALFVGSRDGVGEPTHLKTPQMPTVVAPDTASDFSFVPLSDHLLLLTYVCYFPRRELTTTLSRVSKTIPSIRFHTAHKNWTSDVILGCHDVIIAAFRLVSSCVGLTKLDYDATAVAYLAGEKLCRTPWKFTLHLATSVATG